MEDNYAKSAEKTKKLFLEYDQKSMIDSFSLEADESYMYLSFFGRNERISRSTATIEYLSEGTWINSSYAEYMTIYDVLSRCMMPVLTGEMVPAKALLKSVYRSGVAEGYDSHEAEFLDSRFDDLKTVCEDLGSIEEGNCDLECVFSLFEFLPVRFRFWRKDAEFPAEIEYLWDRCTLDHMYFETTQFCERFITDNIEKKIRAV